MSSYRPVTPEYFASGLTEGAWWATFLGIETAFLYSDVVERRNVAVLPDSHPMKADLLWEKTKNTIISSALVVSTLSITINSLARAQYLALGNLAPPVAFLGYSGRALSSLAGLWESSKELAEGLYALFTPNGQKTAGNTHFLQLQNFLRVAFYVTSAAWGILGAVCTCLGADSLFPIVDALFYQATLLAGANLLALIGVSLLQGEEKEICI
ncbi:MAG: hypothetical protein KR126chlam1_00972 [Chlamydiae bacterium]|nr:hypothetical protein [Chlamydiota bacterium]